MVLSNTHRLALIVFSVLLVALPTSAQDSSIYVQCPTATVLHPDTDSNDATREDGIQCNHLVAGDGMVTMADDAQKQQYIFSFAEVPLPEAAPVPLPEYPGWVMEQGVLAANSPAPICRTPKKPTSTRCTSRGDSSSKQT